MAQYGFFFDQSRCIGCSTCHVACKDWNDIAPGPARWLRVYQWEEGTFPTPRLRNLIVQCYHCENPVCVDACPNHAMYKEEKYGAVLVDSTKCKGARQCWMACPYGSIAYESDMPGVKAQKCTMCIDRLEQGLKPVCVTSCSQRALDFDTLENLQKKYGTSRDLQPLPSSTQSKPAVVFKPSGQKRNLVPYNTDKVLELMAGRENLPPLYDSKDQVTAITPGLIGRTKLNLKPSSSQELIKSTITDDG